MDCETGEDLVKRREAAIVRRTSTPNPGIELLGLVTFEGKGCDARPRRPPQYSRAGAFLQASINSERPIRPP